MVYFRKLSISRYQDGYIDICSSKSSKWDKSQVPDPFRRVVTNFVKLEKTKTQLIMRSTKGTNWVLKIKIIVQMGAMRKSNTRLIRNRSCSSNRFPLISKADVMADRSTRPLKGSASHYFSYLHESVWRFYIQVSLCRDRQSVSSDSASDTLVLIKLCG